ncbi:serine/threonine kinase 16 [Fusarium oxysporum]|nr:serine/threonine kinase 16 [Fusarium oxysporum]
MFPPGTVRLGDPDAVASREGIILQPRPTEDPNGPLNWPNWRKYINFGLVSFYVLMVSEFINSAGPTWGPMQKELGFSDEALTASYAIGCACLAIGAVMLIPFALKFGRRPLYPFSSLVQIGVGIWSAKIQNVPDLLLVNAINNIFGALAEVIVQMTIADVFFIHQRGTLNSIYIWFWQISVSLGPFIAGYITTGQGWRWVWWWNAILFGAFFILVCFCYEETKYCTGGSLAPVQRDVEDDSKSAADRPWPASVAVEEGSQHNPYAVRVNYNIPKKTYWQRLALTTTSSSSGGLRTLLSHMYQPIILLTTVPAVAYTALAYGILVATSDVMSTTLSLYMTKPPYTFAPNEIGLMNLSKLVGSTIGTLIVGPVSDTLILWLARRNDGIYEPETRLWSLVPFLPFIPAGALLFGLGLQNGLPWPIIAVALALFKLGMAPVNSITITYLTDSYQDVIGDALVGVTIVRNAFSTAFIFALDPWIRSVGIQWVLITIVLITTVILSLTGVLTKYGKPFRAHTAERYQRFALLQYKER